MTLYTFLKFLHVLAVVLWVGGTIQFALLAGFFSRDAAAMRVLGQGGLVAGRYLLMPGSIITLLTGIALMIIVGGHPPFWMTYGFIAGPGSAIIGAVFIRRAALALATAMENPGNTAAIEPMRSRLMTLTIVNVALQVSGVAMMVIKPVF